MIVDLNAKNRRTLVLEPISRLRLYKDGDKYSKYEKRKSMIPTRGVRLLGLRADTKGRSLVSENFT
jgi:hypothetical protein